MSELDAFEAKVQQHIKLLSAPDARTRRRAAAWLGEAGDPSAITRLRQIYERDPDRKVRAAAAYSLGMFRALEQGMNGEDSEAVYDLLEDIALHGKMGRRLPVPTGVMRRVVFGLLVSLTLLLVFSLLIWPQFGPQIDNLLNPGAAAASALPALESRLRAIRQDARFLQAQYADPSTLDCTTEFVNPVSVTANQPRLMPIVNDLNAQIVALAVVKAPYNQACLTEPPALDATQAAAQLPALDDLLSKLGEIEAALADAT
jgi:hypothetical protein